MVCEYGSCDGVVLQALYRVASSQLHWAYKSSYRNDSNNSNSAAHHVQPDTTVYRVTICTTPPLMYYITGQLASMCHGCVYIMLLIEKQCAETMLQKQDVANVPT